MLCIFNIHCTPLARVTACTMHTGAASWPPLPRKISLNPCFGRIATGDGTIRRACPYCVLIQRRRSNSLLRWSHFVKCGGKQLKQGQPHQDPPPAMPPPQLASSSSSLSFVPQELLHHVPKRTAPERCSGRGGPQHEHIIQPCVEDCRSEEILVYSRRSS